MPQKRSNKTPTTKARPTKRNGRAAKSAHAPGSTSSFTRVRPTTRKKGAFSRPAQARGSAHATPEGRFSPEVLLTRRNLLIGAGVIGGIAAVGGDQQCSFERLLNQYVGREPFGPSRCRYRVG